jgi:hypothetical protein
MAPGSCNEKGGTETAVPPQPSAHAAAPSPADSTDKVLILRFSHRAVLVLCVGDAEVSLPCPGVSCLSSSPSPSIVRTQPCRLAAVADALLGMVNSDLLLLLLLLRASEEETMVT